MIGNYDFALIIQQHSCSKCHKKSVNKDMDNLFDLDLEIADNKIINGVYISSNCAMQNASCSILLDIIIGIKVNRAKQIINLFISMLSGNKLSKIEEESLDEALVFQKVVGDKENSRIVLLPWLKALEILK